MTGKIYFVSGPGRIKIGYTTKPETRLKQLRHVDMEPLEIIAIADGSQKMENRLQAMAQPYCIRAEWFRDCPEVRRIIDDFVSGKIVFDKFGQDIEPPEPVVAASKAEPDLALARESSVRSAIAEASSLGDEIAARIKRGESISDLVRSACFLVEHVIVPGLGKMAP